MASPDTLRQEAARAGVTVDDYTTRLSRGELWCEACEDWHLFAAFPADGRRRTRRATSCYMSIRAAASTTAADVTAARGTG